MEKTWLCIAEMYLLDEKWGTSVTRPWIVNYADSEDVSHVNCSADKIFDLQESTYWSTNKRHSIPHSVIDWGYPHPDRHTISAQNGKRGTGWNKDFKVYVKSKAFNY